MNITFQEFKVGLVIVIIAIYTVAWIYTRRAK